MFLQRGRNQLAEADGLASQVTTEPGPAIEAYGIARESLDRVLQDDATQAEALEARRRIDEQLRTLAERVEKERGKERDITTALDTARAAVAETEIAGSARAGDLGTIAALLHEADVALDRVLAIDLRHSDAVPLRARVGSLRADVLKEQERRDAQAAAAQRVAEEAERRRVEVERDRARQAEDAERARVEEERHRVEEERHRVEEERRAAEKVEREQRAAEKRAVEDKKPRPATKPGPEPAPQADSRKLAEFEKGLAKHRRLAQQGKAREASDIRRILETEAAADPQLKDLYLAAFPAPPPGRSGRGLVWGAIAGVIVLGTAGVGYFVSRGPEPSAAPVPTASIVREAPPEPFTPPPPVVQEAPLESAPQAPIPAEKPPAQQQAREPVIAPPASKPVPKPQPPAATVPKPAPATVSTGSPAPKQEPATAAQELGGHIRACLTTAAGGSAGAGYRIGFSISGLGDRETPATDSSGCANLDFELGDSARFQPTYAKGARGERLEVVQPQPRKIYQGIPQSIQVRINL
jgi:outer membrane biosynthesis protein TonB